MYVSMHSDRYTVRNLQHIENMGCLQAQEATTRDQGKGQEWYIHGSILVA